MSSRAGRIRLFLDANVLVSVAWKDESKVARIWQIPAVELVTSNFMVAECERNLPLVEQLDRLHRFLNLARVLEFRSEPVLEHAPSLAAKDRHVLAAAVLARASYLVTGDRAHFGQWYGQVVLGVRIEPPWKFPGVLQET